MCYLTRSHLEHLDLSHGDASYGWIVATLQELLDGHYLARLLVATLEHLAIGALAYLADLLVLVHPIRYDTKSLRTRRTRRSREDLVIASVGSKLCF